MPAYVRNQSLKRPLDEVLTTIPDEPQIPGYSRLVRAASNSLLLTTKTEQSINTTHGGLFLCWRLRFVLRIKLKHFNLINLYLVREIYRVIQSQGNNFNKQATSLLMWLWKFGVPGHCHRFIAQLSIDFLFLPSTPDLVLRHSLL